RFLNAVQCSLRTNFFQTAEDGWAKEWISVKLDSKKIDELPLPRPMVEIFVYSPRMEGIHLRGGKVARGGIRWSDRREDFRTEILSLMKAQMVKNAVIVPVGSKGGFVVKHPPVPSGQPVADREALNAEVVACYSILMYGLLDITDNLYGAEIVPPQRVVRLDGDDPYLVVAADKGTASFSDIANGIARDYGFWLDDAFASGGSVGYDHKKMGITARGAWECVKRHFRELGLDTQKTPFTAVGVGDMSGDVFGNGMLQSKCTRLLAAFDHRHIFLDPAPDVEKSLAERQRLFDLPRSSWDDYNKELISQGGGVFARSLKSIPLSEPVRKMLDIAADHATPSELMLAILKARVDLLWFGGIGTYVKASSESSADAGDRANDANRIDGKEIRAHVVGEGANLGVTQRGRIEAAQTGIKINTDAMDNSAGVDCSDHEVNIKIGLGNAVKAGDLTMEQRDAFLATMTDEVAALVLRDNYQQSQAISVAEAQAPATIGQHARMMRNLELAGKLDRAVEFLPGRDALTQRQANNRGLTRPELCVLLAYAKITLNEELLESDLPDDPLLEPDLLQYFPPEMADKFKPAIEDHRLGREIIATRVTNSMINRVGSAFVDEVADRTGARGADITRAYALARDIYSLRGLWREIEALDEQLVAQAQIDMLIATQRLVDTATVWLLRNLPAGFDAQSAVQRFAPQIEKLRGEMPDLLPQTERNAFEQRVQALTTQRAPLPLAQRIAALEPLGIAPELVRLAERQSVAVEAAAKVYFAVGERFGLAWLRDTAQKLPRDTQWQGLAVGALVDDLTAQQAELAAALLAAGQRDAELAPGWLEPRRRAVDRLDRLFADLRSQGITDLAMLTVAARELRALATPIDKPVPTTGAPAVALA
ncbi:MAG: NAD-glutamate dehydrogenase domain-containing protein, partial [Rhodospirillales bacterium]